MPSVDGGMENKKFSGAADGSINQYSQPGEHTGLSITILRGRRATLLRIFISREKSASPDHVQDIHENFICTGRN